jgi:glycosyltransferase involved in cell wall biosynthesis
MISEKDYGISDAFNKGINQCKSDFILLLNSDDQLIENGLASIKRLLTTEDQIVCTKMLSYYNNKCIGEYSSSLSEIRNFNSILHPGCIVSHHTYKKIGGYDLSFKVAMDYDFFSRCFISKVNFRSLDLPLVAFREGGRSHQKKYLVLKESFLIRKKYFNAKFPMHELLKLFSRQAGELLNLFGQKEAFKRFLGKL